MDMPITKDAVIDKIEILEDGTIQVRRALYFVEDGVRNPDPSRYHRTVHTPDTPLPEVPAGVLRQIADLVWTPAIIAAYIAKQGVVTP